MDRFNLLARAIALSFGGFFYHFDTYSAMAAKGCYIRAYNIGGRISTIVSINLQMIEIDHATCLDVLWRIIFRTESYRSVIKAALPQPISEELNEHIIMPINIVYEEFSRV